MTGFLLVFLIIFTCLKVFPMKNDEDADLREAIESSMVTYRAEQEKQTRSNTSPSQIPGATGCDYEPQPQHVYEEQAFNPTFHAGCFFFSPEAEQRTFHQQSLRSLQRSAPKLHACVVNLKDILENPDAQLDTKQLQRNIIELNGELNQFTQSAAYAEIRHQDGALHNFHADLKKITRHPSVRLLSEPLDYWNDLIPVCLDLNNHREEANDKNTSATRGKYDSLNAELEHLKRYLDSSNDRGDELLDRIEPAKQALSKLLKELGKQAHYLHPKNYPKAFDVFARIIKDHGTRIKRAELKHLPEDALAESVFNEITVLYLKKNDFDPYNAERLSGSLKHSDIWSREEKRTFVQLFLDSSQSNSLETLAAAITQQMSTGDNHAILSGHRPSIAPLQSDLVQTTGRQLMTSGMREEVETPNILDISVQVHTESNRMKIGVFVFRLSMCFSLLSINELNLPELLRRPPASHRKFMEHSLERVERQLKVAKKGDGYLRHSATNHALAKKLLAGKSPTLPTNNEKPGVYSTILRALGWKS